MSRHSKTNHKPEVHDDDGNDSAPAGKVRVDKWLWAARFFKTRSLAGDAVDGGKVDVNGERAKPSKLVQAGDLVELRQGPELWQLDVRDIAARRGSAEIAQSLYTEREAGRIKREAIREQNRNMQTAFSYGDNRPGKRDRRELRRFKGGE